MGARERPLTWALRSACDEPAVTVLQARLSDCGKRVISNCTQLWPHCNQKIWRLAVAVALPRDGAKAESFPADTTATLAAVPPQVKH